MKKNAREISIDSKICVDKQINLKQKQAINISIPFILNRGIK